MQENLLAGDTLPTLCVGDFNQPVEELSFDDATPYFVQDEGGQPAASRWGSNRCIDYVLALNIQCSELKHSTEVWSDHKEMRGRLHRHCPHVPDFAMMPTPCLRKPDGVAPHDWKQSLEQECGAIPLPQPSTTDTEWAELQASICAAFDRAYHKHNASLYKPPCSGLKGDKPRICTARACPRLHNGAFTFKQRKLRKLLGRVREYARQIQADTEPPRLLYDKIVKTWPKDLTWALTWEAREATIQAALEALTHDESLSAIQKWRRDMHACGKKATKWLTKGVTRPVTAVTRGGAVASTQSESLLFIRDFWRTIWNRDRPAVAPALQKWRTAGQRQAVEVQNVADLWSPATLQAAARKQAGSAAGPCGWTGDELASLPLPVWVIYSQLISRWLSRGVFPAIWQYARQVHLAKEDVSVSEGTSDVSQMRPICVLSCWWRVLTSAIASHEAIRTWSDQVCDPTQFGGLSGRGVTDALAALSSEFHLSSSKILVSLDYAKCFDNTDPELSLAIMQEAGFPSMVCQMLKHVWCNQQRFLQFEGAVLPCPERVVASLPQGDGLSPLALNILLSAACRAVQRQMGPGYMQSVFLDDRALVCSNPQQAKQAMTEWSQWSKCFGLVENAHKNRSGFETPTLGGRTPNTRL